MKTRTTLTLDPDVARQIEEEMRRQRRPARQVINDALRRGLSPQRPAKRGRPYRVVPHAARLLPGIDRASLNRLGDELEAEARGLKLKHRGR